MGLLQAAYRTYEVQSHRSGVITETEREPLTPVSHMVQNAQIEITITDEGKFMSARPIPKEDNRTIIPVTVKSANRTGKLTKGNIHPHPLCDQIGYIAPCGGEKFEMYLQNLSAWADSKFSHPKVAAIRNYIAGETILCDLAQAGILTLDENGQASGRIEGIEWEKCLVRFCVDPAPEGVSPACWQDSSLFDRYISYYGVQLTRQGRDICLISGEEDSTCSIYPKGIIPAQNGAKLISSNDASGFTYRGRFTEARQACSVGYTAAQKAHNALRWVAVNHGVPFGGRTFLCWNPEGEPVPDRIAFLGLPSEEPRDFISYKKALKETLGSYRNLLSPQSSIVVAALDAATTGRLSVTYYNELKGSDFLAHIGSWYESCCWNSRKYGVQSPSLCRIVNCAFGTQKGEKIEADDKVLREHIQQLLPCVITAAPMPRDIVRALATRAGTPSAYTRGNREILLTTACAVIRKFHNDQKLKEEWTLGLDKNCPDRSYLFGRLLAVAEQVERSTYRYDEDRETNAIKMQSVFSQRPMYAWRIISERLVPYFTRMKPGLRNYFKDIICEIEDKLNGPDDSHLGDRLDDTYLLGYYHQRSALTTKKNATETEEN